MSVKQSLRFSCPSCGQHIECDGEWAGKELNCPACANPMRAPAAERTPEPASATPFPAPHSRLRPLARAPRRAPSWLEHASNLGIVAPLLIIPIMGIAILFSVRAGIVANLTLAIVILLWVGGCLAALVALVLSFLTRSRIPKAVAAVGINFLMTLVMVPAVQRAWERHLEIRREEASGVREMHAQGMYYVTNKTIPRPERVKAVELLSEAANLGFSPSQYTLAHCYRTGIGTPTNRVLAWKWYTIAARNGSTKASSFLAQMQAEMPPEEISEGERLAQSFEPVKQTPRTRRDKP